MNIYIIIIIYVVVVTGIAFCISKMIENADNAKARKEEAALKAEREQRAMWAEKVKKRAADIDNICERNKLSDKQLVTATYKSNAEMKEIINGIANIVELMGMLESIMNEKDGGQL